MSIKNTSFFCIVILALLVAVSGCDKHHDEETITISGAFALYPLTVRWKEAYAELHPEIRIEVAAGGAGKGMTDVLAGFVDIAMVSRNVHPAETEQGALSFAVAKDAVIPVINRDNPDAMLLDKRGVTREECAAVWIARTVRSWKQLPGLIDARAMNVYTRADACGAGEVWAAYLGGKAQDVLGGVRVLSDPGLAEAVAKDPLGVGYNNIGFAYDPTTLRPVEGLAVLKIDFNGNGRIDSAEDFYDTRTDLVAAIRDNRFPSPPARKLFLVTKGQPAREPVRKFLVWTLTDGQRYLDECGYIAVEEEMIKQCLAELRK